MRSNGNALPPPAFLEAMDDLYAPGPFTRKKVNPVHCPVPGTSSQRQSASIKIVRAGVDSRNATVTRMIEHKVGELLRAASMLRVEALYPWCVCACEPPATSQRQVVPHILRSSRRIHGRLLVDQLLDRIEVLIHQRSHW